MWRRAWYLCKRKTAYELRISDGSSDVDSSEPAAAHVHCAHADPHIAGVEAVEVHQPLARLAQRVGVVEGCGGIAGERREQGRRKARLEEAALADKQGAEGSDRVASRAQVEDEGQVASDPFVH